MLYQNWLSWNVCWLQYIYRTRCYSILVQMWWVLRAWKLLRYLYLFLQISLLHLRVLFSFKIFYSLFCFNFFLTVFFICLFVYLFYSTWTRCWEPLFKNIYKMWQTSSTSLTSPLTITIPYLHTHVYIRNTASCCAEKEVL